jgi:hypothetical protein
MRWSNVFAASLSLAVCAGFAAAGPVPVNTSRVGPYMGGGTDDPYFPAVVVNDAASCGLKVYANPNVSGFVNQGGDAEVTRGPTFTNIGTGGAYGSYNVLTTWDEFVGANSNIVQVVWKTSNAQRFIPQGATVGGLAVQFLEWRLGVSDPVTFGFWVTGNMLVSATISSSTNGGTNFQNFDITSSLSNPWNGEAHGTTLPISFFNAANYIQLTVEYIPIPSPGVLSLAAAAGLCVFRRRRSVG